MCAACALAATVACTDGAPPLALQRPPRDVFRGAITTTATRPATVAADSVHFATRVVGADDDGQWEATLRSGRVELIRELQGAPGYRRVRVYAFDSLGALRGYSERGFRTSDTGPLDITRIPDRGVLAVDSVALFAPEDQVRTSAIFLADLPVLYARAGAGGPLAVARIEFRNLVARAHQLYTVAQARRVIVPR
ncbi:MAG: hypothetical protein ACK5W7_07975 [Gemmatimonadaceae bacterium]